MTLDPEIFINPEGLFIERRLVKRGSIVLPSEGVLIDISLLFTFGRSKKDRTRCKGWKARRKTHAFLSI